MIIWGTRGLSRTISTGEFHCPSCATAEPYQHKQVRKWGHVYWIPIIPMGDPTEYIECQSCKDTYRVEVLSMAPQLSGAQLQSEFDKAAKRMMVMIMMADGSIQDEEVQTISSVFKAIADEELPRADVMAEVAQAEREATSLPEYLSAVAPYLNNHGKELLIKAAFLVAAADGEIDESELEQISFVAGALDLSATHVKGIVTEMNEQSE